MKKRFFLQIGLYLAAIASLSSGLILELKAMADTAPTWYNCLTREVFTLAKKSGAIAGERA
ncbi:hypothetical protein OsccyDRAFT_4590 [Leptolyngbyaceae cyanobacterium JSC-12]|nr:hypothetical protein OsccyDRAFT_4590 [Leptolyngbyaceae cyanobacterium JSC-12]